MKGKREAPKFPSIPELFKGINDIVGGLDKLNKERLAGNLEPTKMLVNILHQYIQQSPIESVVSNVIAIRMLLGEEDCNTELLEGVESAIRDREKSETALKHTKVALQLNGQSLRLLIEDSQELNKSISNSPSSSPPPVA